MKVVNDKPYWVGCSFNCSSCQRTVVLTEEDAKNGLVVEQKRFFGGKQNGCIKVTCVCGHTTVYDCFPDS